VVQADREGPEVVLGLLAMVAMVLEEQLQFLMVQQQFRDAFKTVSQKEVMRVMAAMAAKQARAEEEERVGPRRAVGTGATAEPVALASEKITSMASQEAMVAMGKMASLAARVEMAAREVKVDSLQPAEMAAVDTEVLLLSCRAHFN
jgi:hypothetical protein